MNSQYGKPIDLTKLVCLNVSCFVAFPVDSDDSIICNMNTAKINDTHVQQKKATAD